MKKVLICCVFLLASVIVAAQAPASSSYLGSYTQPAPNVGSLGKFVDYPVSYYTGTPNISIPIFDLQDGAANTSVSLSYHASGIRVAELSSWVGLGWALNAGGMITRSIRSGPDEGVYSMETETAIGGYYRDYGLSNMTLLAHPVNGVITPGNNDQYKTDRFRTALQYGKADAEPDLFTFNFNGYGGKFVFDENRTPRLLTDQDVKITVHFDGNIFTSWTITTPDGVRYYFGEGGVREINAVTSAASGYDNNSSKPTTWLLTRIVYPNTKDTLYFNYAPETYSYFDLAQETKIFGIEGSPLQQACALDARPSNVNKTTVSGYRLVNITSRNYKIVFGVNTASARQDLASSAGNYPYSLDSIKIYNAQNQCLKQFVLGHDYFTSTTANNMWTPVLGFIAGDVTDTKRLKLLSVKEYSGDGLTSKPAHTFTYEETYQLPRRLSYDIDHWGYSNNSAGNVNDRFTPQVSHPICLVQDQAANRNPHWPYMQQYTIKTIKDPLGVLTTFEFEAHRSSLVTQGDLVGGLRIKKITTTDGVTGISNVRSYSYAGGGTLYRVPKYLIIPSSEYYSPLVIMGAGYSYQGYGAEPTIRMMVRQSQSIIPLQDFQGNHIGYSSVKETFGLNGEGGYTIYNFMADQLLKGNSRLDMSNYTAYATITTSLGVRSGIYGNGQFNGIAPQDLDYYEGNDVENYYPFAPQQVEFRRGQLLMETTYDSSGVLIREVRNNYEQIFHEDALIRGLMVNRVLRYTGYSGEPFYEDALAFYKLRTGVSHMTSTITKDLKDGKVMTNIAYYKYESPYHTLKTQDSTINSTGDIIVNKTYYSFDYTNGATADGVFAKMKARNFLVPVASRTWRNNQLVNGTVILYKDFATNASDTFINPFKIYAIETASPLTVAQAGESILFTAQFTTLLPNSYFKEKASFNVHGTTGKITEQKLVNDKTQSLIWDNMLGLPLAQTENAVLTDIAYSSFESSEAGNWTYNSNSVTTDATAPTGGKVYTVSGGFSKSGLTSANKYILSYWLKTGGSVSVSGGTQSNSLSGRTRNGWTYKQVTITGTTSISLSGSGSIDEVRLHPALAQMTTYTYDALLRLVALTSVNNTINYYEYDSMNRLVSIKDQYGNVIKAYEYNYGSSSR
jgi:hypothetical protein